MSAALQGGLVKCGVHGGRPMVLSAERMYKSGLVKCGEHVLERALWTDALSWQCLSQDGASSPPARVNVWMPSDLPQRARFPEDSPELCVTFFTCVGTGIAGVADLQTTYPAAVTYLEAQAVRYELVWLDNGSEREVLDGFVQRGAQLDKLLHNPTNQGLFHAANDVWFRGRGCRAPYVLSLEDDRVPRPGVAWRVPHLRHSLAILQAEGDGVLGVHLKHEWSDAHVARANPPRTPRWWTAASGEVRYLTHCFAPASGLVWGSFSMAGVVYDRLRLLRRVGL